VFNLSHKEREEFEIWNKKHKKKCKYCKPINQTAIGGRLTYMFTPNGVGYTLVIKCKCGKEVDVTDNSCW